MSDTSPWNPTSTARMLADALLRRLTGTTAALRVTPANTDGAMSEVGLVATTFSQVSLSPVVIRRMRPVWEKDGAAEWELLVSATSVEQQVNALELTSARALFAMTMAVTVAGQDYQIESIAANEAFGQVYMYRLLLRETRPQSL